MMDAFLIENGEDKAIYRDESTNGFISHSKDRAINAAGKASALAQRQVAQAVKEKELSRKEEELQLKGMETMMSAMMAKQSADQQVSGLTELARQLAFQQATLDGRMSAQMDAGKLPPLPLDPSMGGLPSIPLEMGGQPPLPQPMNLPPGGELMGGPPVEPMPQPGPIPVDGSFNPPMM